MWKSLRSDLKEFVSSVADDSTTVLGSINIDKSDSSTSRQQEDLSSNDFIERSHIEEEGDATDENVKIVLGEDGDVAFVGNLAAEEQERRMALEETYTESLLPNEFELANDKISLVDKTVDKEPSLCEERDTESPRDSESSAEVKSTTDTEQLDTSSVEDTLGREDNQNEIPAIDSSLIDEYYEVDVKSFIESFDITTKTGEIADILELNHDTVAFHFEKLVPVTVSYAEFWRRYFYRCDLDRIQDEFDNEEERIQQKRQELIDKGMKSVKNLFGGALQAFKNVNKVEERKGSIYEKYQAEVQEQQRAVESKHNDSTNEGEGSTSISMNMGLFGGRPPFVMDTTDSYDEEEDNVEDEEGFGWGSDEEESIEENESSHVETDENETDNEITFEVSERKELVKLQSQLAEAQLKNSQLQETLDEQQCQLAEPKDINEDMEDFNLEDEIERLKLLLFERDSELAAVKASFNDMDREITESNIDKSNKVEKNDPIEVDDPNHLRDKLSKLTEAHELVTVQNNSNMTALTESNKTVTRLSKDLGIAVAGALESAKEIEILRKKLDETEKQGEIEIDALKKAQMLSNKMIENMKLDQRKAKECVLESESKVESLKLEKKEQHDNYTKLLAEKESEDLKPEITSPDGDSGNGSSMSSGVNIPLSDANISNDLEEEDWGETWSED